MSFRSIEAYKEILPKITAKEESILNVLCIGSYKAESISKFTSIPLITTRARLSELFDKGVINQYEDGSYFLVDPEETNNIKEKRLEEKYLKWKKLGEKHGWHFRYEVFDKHGQEPLPKDYE